MQLQNYAFLDSFFETGMLVREGLAKPLCTVDVGQKQEDTWQCSAGKEGGMVWEPVVSAGGYLYDLDCTVFSTRSHINQRT